MTDSKKRGIDLMIVGRIDDARFHMAVSICKTLSNEYTSIRISTCGLFEAEWDEFISKKMKELSGGQRIRDHTDAPLVMCDGNVYVGDQDDLLTWAKRNYQFVGEAHVTTFEDVAKSAYIEKLEKSGNKYCYMDLASEDAKLGRVVFELYYAICPKTCKNFEALCTGEHGNDLCYEGSLIHRVVPGGWVQGGDICSGNGDTGASIYEDGGDFADENFAANHDAPGTLAMVGDGRHTNNSQFYVTFQALPWLNGKRVVFGRVVSGMRVLRTIEKCKTENQRPLTDVVVKKSGLVLLDGRAMPSDTSSVATRTNLLKYVFGEIDRGSLGRVGGEELVRGLEISSSLQRDFPDDHPNVRKAVSDRVSSLASHEPSRGFVSRKEFVDLALSVLDGTYVEMEEKTCETEDKACETDEKNMEMCETDCEVCDAK